MSNAIIPGRVVVCAAVRLTGDDGQGGGGEIVIPSVRHYDRHTHALKGLIKINVHKEEQGFLDQHGVFMDRFEALRVATEAGQINVRRAKTSPQDRLFSEDLY